MNLSYWEIKNWFTGVDFTIAGSGIVGLHTALRLRERFPESKILIIEKGPLPQGASTKNAGFASFGSLSEITEDLKNHTEQEVINLIRKRWQGLQLLRNRLGDTVINFKQHGGYELFFEDDTATYNECLHSLTLVNNILRPLFNADVFNKQPDTFGFKGIKPDVFYNPFEGQIDTGAMMQALLRKAALNNILVLNNQAITGYHEHQDTVEVQLETYSFTTKKLLFATNGFAEKLTNGAVKPARAQVLITEPIPGLAVKGTFHLDKGYYYFRNIDNRILFGGARNLDFEGENTTDFGNTNIIQNRLDEVLRELILPNADFTIAHRWSGIMGMGSQKTPVVKQLSPHMYCGVRLGGIGVAIGSMVGKELGDLV